MLQRLSTNEGRVMPGEEPSTTNLSERLSRLEESLGYTDRTVEHLSAEIAEMNKRMQAIGKRLGALEAGMRKLKEPGDDPGTDEAQM